MKNHERCGTYPVLKDRCALRHEPLRSREAVEYIRTIFVQVLYMRAHRGVFYKVCTEIIAQDVFGDVILGRPQATGG